MITIIIGSVGLALLAGQAPLTIDGVFDNPMWRNVSTWDKKCLPGHRVALNQAQLDVCVQYPDNAHTVLTRESGVGTPSQPSTSRYTYGFT